MPDTIMGSRFADMRLGPVILALFVLAAAPRAGRDGPAPDPRLMRWLLIGGLVFAGARLATNTASMAMAGAQFAETLTAIEAVPSGQLIAIHNPALAPFDRDPSTITFLDPCRASPGLAETVRAIPRAARYLWVIRLDPATRLPGWEALRKTRDSVLYRRLPTQPN